MTSSIPRRTTSRTGKRDRPSGAGTSPPRRASSGSIGSSKSTILRFDSPGLDPCCENRAVVESEPQPMPLARARRALLRWYRTNGRHDLPWGASRSVADPASGVDAAADSGGPGSSSVPSGRRPMADGPAFRTGRPRRRARRPPSAGLLHRLPRLKAAARAADRGVPRTLDTLMAVPGVGRYAATATLSFAYGRHVAVVDPAVIRILERFSGHRSDRSRPRDDAATWKAAQALLPGRSSREWNYAMLDLGALVCRPKPQCSMCPLRPWCRTGSKATTA